MIDLLLEYRKSREGLEVMLNNLGNTEVDEQDRKLINSMIRSVSDIIKWLETGRNSYYEQGIDVKRVYDITSLANMDILPDIEEFLTEEREPLEIEKEHVLILREIASRLSKREWECFVLNNALHMSMSEIADELDVSKATVQTHIDRARAKIERIKEINLSLSYGCHT